MRLQLALDTGLKKGLNISKKVSDYVDIIEIGTPLIKKEGSKVVKKFKKFKKPIMADLKTMDTGFIEAEIAFQNGAEITSVLGVSDIDTISGAIRAAKKYKSKVLVDLINLKDKNKIKNIIGLKPDYICVHKGIDMQNRGEEPFEEFRKTKRILDKLRKSGENKKTKLCIAGGICLENIDRVIKEKPDVVIVGGAITKSDNPKDIAKQLSNKLGIIKWK